MIESSAGRRFSCNIIPYFCRKLGKISQNLSSAAVVIGAVRTKTLQCIMFPFCSCYDIIFTFVVAFDEKPNNPDLCLHFSMQTIEQSRDQAQAYMRTNFNICQ